MSKEGINKFELFKYIKKSYEAQSHWKHFIDVGAFLIFLEHEDQSKYARM